MKAVCIDDWKNPEFKSTSLGLIFMNFRSQKTPNQILYLFQSLPTGLLRVECKSVPRECSLYAGEYRRFQGCGV